MEYIRRGFDRKMFIVLDLRENVQKRLGSTKMLFESSVNTSKYSRPGVQHFKVLLIWCSSPQNTLKLVLHRKIPYNYLSLPTPYVFTRDSLLNPPHPTFPLPSKLFTALCESIFRENSKEKLNKVSKIVGLSDRLRVPFPRVSCECQLIETIK
jgi:hypothetical protein